MNLYQKTYSALHPIRLNVRKMTRWQDDEPLTANYFLKVEGKKLTVKK